MWGVVEDLEELKEENEYNQNILYERSQPTTYTQNIQMKSLVYTVNRCL